MDAKHSPLPWMVHVRDSVVSISSNGVHVAAVGNKPYYQHHDQTDLADAAFIISACNAHDDLVAAVRAAVSSAVLEPHLRAMGSLKTGETLYDAFCAALAKAEDDDA